MGSKSEKKAKRKIDDGTMHETRMVTVTDDWCPCYPDNQVAVTIWARREAGHKDTYSVNILVWGMDDTGVALRYEAGEHVQNAYVVYDHWKEWVFDRIPDGVNREWFYEHGFLPA